MKVLRGPPQPFAPFVKSRFARRAFRIGFSRSKSTCGPTLSNAFLEYLSLGRPRRPNDAQSPPKVVPEASKRRPKSIQRRPKSTKVDQKSLWEVNLRSQDPLSPSAHSSKVDSLDVRFVSFFYSQSPLLRAQKIQVTWPSDIPWASLGSPCRPKCSQRRPKVDQRRPTGEQKSTQVAKVILIRGVFRGSPPL